jgi:hypothetical protein
MDKDQFLTHRADSELETQVRARLGELFARSPLPASELLCNLGLFMRRRWVSRLLFMHELYRLVQPINGVILEFGTRWGQNLSLFQAFRAIHEPYNYTRRIVGFDTFSGFPSVAAKDGAADCIAPGAYSVSEGYEHFLAALLQCHEADSPLSHITKHELVKGDVTRTVPEFFERHPESIVALAYFDLDLYEPTKVCLEAVKSRLTKGSVLAFDELNHPTFPGETQALREVLGLDRYRIVRTPYESAPSYLVIE